MIKRREASVLGDIPSVWVGDMYTRGEPRNDCVIKRKAWGTDGAAFRFSVVPTNGSVTLFTAFREPFDIKWQEFEPTVIEMEWADWSFNSRRPYILCSECLGRASRAFIVTRGLGAFLCCRRCAGVRYRSQDASFTEYLTARIDGIRTHLGGEPSAGKPGTPLPPRPKGMWKRTYWKLAMEINILEGMLADEYRAIVLEWVSHSYECVKRAEQQIAKWEAMSGPYSPYAKSQKRRARAS